MIEEFTRQDAEKLVRQVMANHAGEAMVDDLFNKSVDQLLKDVNGKLNIIEADYDN